MENVVAPLDRKVVYLKLDDILPNRFQPRINFDEQALNELSISIKEHGVLSPITVRPLGNKYEIIAGERRYKASVMAGLTDIPALIVKMDDKESAEIALIENVQRKDLTPIEEAISYKKIFDMNIGISQETLAKKLGKSQSAIANKLRLLNLSDEVQEALLENKISERHARSLLRIKDKKLQNALLNKIITERMTVRKTDEEIINMLNNNKDVEILDFELGNEELKTEKINDPLNRFESLYNLPKTQIIEDKEDEFIPNIPDVLSVETLTKIPEIPKVADNIEGTIQISKEEINKVLQNPVTKEELINGTNTDFIDVTTKEENNINPGFLDISKIEKEANDINQNSGKLSLEELLRMPNKSVSNPVEKESFTPELPKNRFFTMVEEDDNISFEPQESSPVLNVEETKPETNNNFELNFNTKFVPQEPTLFENIDKLDSLNLKEEPNEELSFDSKIFDEKLDFGNLFINQDIDKKDDNIPEITETKKEDVNQEVLAQEIPDFSYDFELPTNLFGEEKEVKENIELPVNEIPEVTEVATPLPQMDYTPVYDFDEINENNEEVEEVQHLETSKYGAADLKTIINTIRKCAETIEKYGYVIDTEEFDFEDMYQVIFKVQKKQ